MKPEARLKLIIGATASMLVLSMVIIYLVGLVVLESNRQLVFQRIVHEHLEKFLSSIKDAETGQRGYLLTGDPLYLTPFNRAAYTIANEEDKLTELGAQGYLPPTMVAELKVLAEKKLQELNHTIELKREGRSEEALSLVQSDLGKDLMDEIRSRVEKLQSIASSESDKAGKRAGRSTHQRNLTFLGATVLNLVFLGWVYQRIRSEIRTRERAQENLRASETRLRIILDSLLEGVVASTPEGTVTDWNPAALKSHGFSNIEEARRHLNQFSELFELSTLEGKVLPVDEWPLGRVLKGEELRDLELQLIDRRNGSQKVMNYSGSLIKNQEGKPMMAVLTITDMTLRKRMEEELRRSHSELEHRVQERTADLAEANKELEAFGYSVSHDLRAPLRHVSGYIKLLEKSGLSKLDPSSQNYVKIISEAADRMGHLIDDLLVLSRIGRTALTDNKVSLREAVEDACQQLSGELKTRSVEWEIGSLPEVRGDIHLLRSAMLNLISNAVKYTRQKNPAKIKVGSFEKDGDHVCYIQDNGAGFDMQFVDKLFGVFQRLHDRTEFEGTGIGLASVRRIIQRHGGKTWAEGAVNQGATFYFSIPKERIL